MGWHARAGLCGHACVVFGVWVDVLGWYACANRQGVHACVSHPPPTVLIFLCGCGCLRWAGRGKVSGLDNDITFDDNGVACNGRVCWGREAKSGKAVVWGSDTYKQVHPHACRHEGWGGGSQETEGVGQCLACV